jgi:hypothetical protein
MQMDQNAQGRRKLKVDLEELKFAFESGFGEMRHFLDLKTGEVVPVTDETFATLETIYEAMGSDEAAPLDLAAWLARRGDLPGWQKEALLEADQVEAGFGTRFIEIPQLETHEAYQDMADFVETVTDPTLHRLLTLAIDGKGAFRRFKTALQDHPAERERWFALKDVRLQERVRDWLEAVGVALDVE